MTEQISHYRKYFNIDEDVPYLSRMEIRFCEGGWQRPCKRPGYAREVGQALTVY